MMIMDTMKIATEANCDPRTVESVYDGRPSRRRVRERIEAAAKKLKLPAPPVIPSKTAKRTKT